MSKAIQFLRTGQPPACQGCGYRLDHLTEPRCPECGRSFDPHDPNTYSLLKFGWGFVHWLAGILLATVFGLIVWLLPSPFAEFLREWTPLVPILISVGFWCRVWPTIGWFAFLWAIIAVTFVTFSHEDFPNRDWNLFLSLGVVMTVATCLLLGRCFRSCMDQTSGSPRRLSAPGHRRWYGRIWLSTVIVLVCAVMAVLPSLGS